jgi:hypothetical protein
VRIAVKDDQAWIYATDKPAGARRLDGRWLLDNFLSA